MSSEQHLELRIGGSAIPMVRRPVSMPAAERTIALIDYGTESRMVGQRAGTFRDGEWRGPNNRKLKEQPRYWTELLPLEKPDGAA